MYFVHGRLSVYEYAMCRHMFRYHTERRSTIEGQVLLCPLFDDEDVNHGGDDGGDDDGDDILRYTYILTQFRPQT